MKQRLVFLSGFLLLGGLWLGPLPELAQQSFTAHMGLHMGVVAVAAPLLAFGIAGTKFDPVRGAPALFPPIPLSLVELVAVWAWHAPALHHAARSSPAGFVAEQSMFLLAGLLVWLSACGGGRFRRRERLGAGITALLLTSMHMTLLGALLALTPRPLYGHTGDVCGFSPLEDQHAGGALMLFVGGVAYLAGGLGLTATFLREGRSPREAIA